MQFLAAKKSRQGCEALRKYMHGGRGKSFVNVDSYTSCSCLRQTNSTTVFAAKGAVAKTSSCHKAQEVKYTPSKFTDKVFVFKLGVKTGGSESW